MYLKERTLNTAVIPAAIEQHAEAAAFLWILRDAVVKAPHDRRNDLFGMGADRHRSAFGGIMGLCLEAMTIVVSLVCERREITRTVDEPLYTWNSEIPAVNLAPQS